MGPGVGQISGMVCSYRVLLSGVFLSSVFVVAGFLVIGWLSVD